MAIQITQVTQIRSLDYSTDSPSGKSYYWVYFSTDTTTEYADYVKKLSMCLTAVNPSDLGVSENISNRIPREGEQLTSIDGSVTFPTYVRNISPKMHEKQNNWWIVEIDYKAPDNDDNGGGSGDGEQLDDDPENLSVDYNWDSKNIKKTLAFDFTPVANGGPIAIVASSKDPFTKLPYVDRAILTCTISRKTRGTYDPLVVAGLLNNINDAPVTINGKGPFPAKTVKVTRWAGKESEAVVTKPGLAPELKAYDQESIVVEIDLERWVGEVFDQGLTFYLDTGASGLPVGRHRIRRNGQKVTTPEPLNGRGATVYDETGVKKNNVTAFALPDEGGVAGEPGVKVVGDQQGAMLLFNFYKASDIMGILGGAL